MPKKTLYLQKNYLNHLYTNQDENNSSTESLDVTTSEDTGATSEEDSTETENAEKSE